MVKGLDEVIPVEVSVDAEDLAEDELAGTGHLLGETASASKPVFGAAELLGGGAGVLWMSGKRHCVWIGREHGRVVHLARHPPLHETHVLVGRQLHRLVVFVEPGIGVVPISACAHALAKALTPLLSGDRQQRVVVEVVVTTLTCRRTSWDMSWDCKCWCHRLLYREGL